MAGPFPSRPAPFRHGRPLSVTAGPFPSRPAPSRHGRPLSVTAGPFPSWPAPFRHGRPSRQAGPFPSWPAPSRHGRPLPVTAGPFPSWPAPFRMAGPRRPLSVTAAPFRHGRPFPSRPAPSRHGRPLSVTAGPFPSWPGLSRDCPAGFLLVSLVSYELPLARDWRGPFGGPMQLVEAPGMHDVELNKPGKGQRTVAVCSFCAMRSSRKAIRATATWMRTALSEVPRKRVTQRLLDPAEEQLDAQRRL